MKRITSTLFLFVAFSFPAATAGAQNSIEELAWMSGCWTSVDGDSGSQEIWMPPAGGTMLGMSRSVKDLKTRHMNSSLSQKLQTAESLRSTLD